MSKPTSIKVEPWTDWPRYSYSVIRDDFCDEKLLTAKFNAKSKKSTINIKQTLTESSRGVTLSDEVKFWFELTKGRSLYAKVSSKDSFKLHYDHGITNFKGERWNWYGSLSSKKSSVSNFAVKLGLAHLGKKCESDTRLKVAFDGIHLGQQWLYNRTILTEGKWTIGFVGAMNLANGVLQKSNLLFGYRHDDKHSVFLRAESDGFRSSPINWSNPRSYFDSVTANYVCAVDANTIVAAEAAFNTKVDSLRSAELVVQRTDPKSKRLVKFGLSNTLTPRILFSQPLPENLGTFAAGFSLENPLKAERRPKVGFEVKFEL